MGDGGVGSSEYHNITLIHPLGLLMTLILGLVLILAPRRYAIAPMVFLACLIPSAQRLVIMGADFNLLRILVLFAWFRLLARNEFEGFVWNRLDGFLVSWMVGGSVIYVLGDGTFSAVVNRCGWMFDGFGMYFFFRCVLREWRDYQFLAQVFIWVSFVVALAFLIERATGRNMFATFGGVPSVTLVRDGRLRCQGAFPHSILAGCFWVGAMPWILAQVARGRKWMGWSGFLAGLFVVVNCASSTPVLAFCFMVLSMGMYAARGHLQPIRWSFFALMVLLHFIMAQPIWHLIARVNVVGGSTGWHRYKVMDATIHNFSEWWLLGEKNPMEWGVWEMRDITNQYILEALRGGLLALVCFVGMIVVAFGIVGRALKACRDKSPEHILVWSIGTSLFVHVCIFFGVSYFGQIIMIWYLTLAMIGSLPVVLSMTPGYDKGGTVPC